MLTAARWVELAACRGLTSTMALPDLRRDDGTRDGYTVRHKAHIAAARQICVDCPVFRECRQWALTWPDPVVGMVAAGMTPRQRDVARGRRVL